MPDSLLAAAFILMIIAPCAVALRSDLLKGRRTGTPRKSPKPHARIETAATAPVQAQPARVFATLTQSEDPAPPRHKHTRPAPVAPTAPQAAPQAIAYEQTPRWQGLTTPPAADPSFRGPVNNSDTLIAQAIAAKAHAAALAAAAQAAAAKAEAAALLARQTARAAAQAHQAARVERDQQARLTQEEHIRRASGEQELPASHPSLDFPRSIRPHRG